MGETIYRFGEFELLSSTGELRTKETCVRLQEKPFRLLLALVENPHRVVTRDQLRHRMWDSETFVDYELGINVAINKVRDALGDSAENPRFIQTIAKKGYRFLLPVAANGTELTREAISIQQSVAVKPAVSPDAPSRGRRLWQHRAFLALVAAFLCALGIWLYNTEYKTHKTVPIHSLAVLPLQNLSPDPGQEYFSDGITEELITNLARSLPLRVTSRTSVMRYKQTSEPITQIARELGVEAIVEGAAARSGNRVTVTIQLIDATQDRHLWAQRYDRSVGDVLMMEGELSQQIASQVGATLRSQYAFRATEFRHVDPQVHELCLMGRYHLNKRTAADLKKSAEYYQQAIAADATYAPAYAGLADAYALSASYSSATVLDRYAEAAAAAHHALELDDTLAEAHATLGLIGLNKSPDWAQMEPEFRRALELNPNYAPAHHWFAFYLYFSARPSEALAQIEQARQLDPLSAVINADEGAFLYAVRRYDDAKARLRQAIELAPDFGQPHETLSLVELETEHPAEALREARTGLTLDPDNPRTMAEAGYVLAITGHPDDARKLLATLMPLVHQGSGSPVFAAFIYVGLGQRNDALDALEQATDPKTGLGIHGLAQWHIFDTLHGDSRYKKLMAQAEMIRILASPPRVSAR